MSTTFNGFPNEAIQFFKDLRKNNQREWFQAHKKDYEQCVLAPAEAFVEALGERLQTISPTIQAIPKTTGGSIMRIYRDVRFSKDKSPYKTNLGIIFWEGDGKKTENPGFYFHLDADGTFFGGGLNRSPKAFMVPFRDALIDERLGAKFEAALQRLQAGYEVRGEQYKSVPQGYDPEHKRADLLRYKGLFISTPEITLAQVASPGLVDICFAHSQVMAPVHHWLVEVNQRVAA